MVVINRTALIFRINVLKHHAVHPSVIVHSELCTKHNDIGEKPRQIYIEFAREDDFKAKNKRTDSRKKTVDKALKKLKKEVVDEYNENVYKELKQYENRLDEEKVYLYFMQNGKSLYTEEKLNLNEPENLEIDHIIPYSLSDDDSLDNKALVLKDENQKKGNKIVKETFPQSFSDIKMINYWKNLKMPY